ncbi:hypothetical protein Sjap_002833 [Stephania japonica]|uniref:Uncharacterized protein n=1 Tax=Stephania japonica TaxID=461633 RepID=A0AAP0KMM0_9MAGN
MNFIMVSLKETISCSCRRNDVYLHSKRGFEDSYKKRPENVERGEKEKRELLLKRQDSNRERIYELNIGDPSRNVIEMIFRKTCPNQPKQVKNIERVLRVKNSTEALKRFEEYRETVKKRAYDQSTKHPRISVDGNELLLFYSTVMACWSLKRQTTASKLCRNQMCGVCRRIRSGFETDGISKRKEILLSTTIGTRSEVPCIHKSYNVKKAVIVCRVIAGSVAVNKFEGCSKEEFDSVGSEGLCSKLEHFFVWNSSAVLPCFVIVY